MKLFFLVWVLETNQFNPGQRNYKNREGMSRKLCIEMLYINVNYIFSMMDGCMVAGNKIKADLKCPFKFSATL